MKSAPVMVSLLELSNSMPAVCLRNWTVLGAQAAVITAPLDWLPFLRSRGCAWAGAWGGSQAGEGGPGAVGVGAEGARAEDPGRVRGTGTLSEEEEGAASGASG